MPRLNSLYLYRSYSDALNFPRQHAQEKTLAFGKENICLADDSVLHCLNVQTPISSIQNLEQMFFL